MKEPVNHIASESSAGIASHFSAMADSMGSRGAAGELAQLLASGSFDVAALDALVERHGVQRETWFRKQVAELFLGCASAVLEGGLASPQALNEIRSLRRYLRIDEGELLALRPVELATILGEQLDRILDDRKVTDSEELLQVELQSALGIGYDDYLMLTRQAFERVHATLTAQASVGGELGEAARQRLRAIEPVYRLSRAHFRSLGARY